LSYDEIRLILAPSISNSEVDRISGSKLLRHSSLVEVCKYWDWPFVVAKCEKSPSPWFKVNKRDAAIVLNDGLAVIEQKLSHPGEVSFVQRYDALFSKLSAGPSLARNAEKPLRSNDPSAIFVLK
jgi:hypothetical protein